MKIKKRIIEIEVNDEYIVGSGVVIGAAGSHNDVILKVRFNSSWVGLNIYATFRDALGENPIQVVLTAVSTLVADESDGDYCVHKFSVPLKAKAYEGKITLSFTGYTVAAVASEDGEGVEYQETQAITSGTAYFNVLKSDAVLADDMFMAANVGQQLHTDVNTLGEMYRDLEKTVKGIEEIQETLDTVVIVRGNPVQNEDEDVGTDEEPKTDEEDAKIYPLLDRIYPIGSIYMSINPTNPARLFGGAWEQLCSRFLVAAENNAAKAEEGEEAEYLESNTGGENEHIHSLNNVVAAYIPHTQNPSEVGGEHWQSKSIITNWNTSYHTYNYDPNDVLSNSNESGLQTHAVGTALVGEMSKESNIPPYLAVYMWKRISRLEEVGANE